MKWTLVDNENVKNPVTYDFIGLADIWALKLAKCMRKKCLTQSMYILMIAKRNWEQYGMVKFSFIYNDILTH